jgi:predicted nuclease with TOPRIM domain
VVVDGIIRAANCQKLQQDLERVRAEHEVAHDRLAQLERDKASMTEQLQVVSVCGRL